MPDLSMVNAKGTILSRVFALVSRANRLRLWLVCGLACTLATLIISALFGIASQPAPAAMATGTFYTVNSQVDEPNASPGSTACASITSTVCTLRAAVMAANANPGADTIRLPAGTFHLTIGGNDEQSQAGDLDITDDVTISGAGDGLTIIDGSLMSPRDRLFDLQPSVHVTMTGLSLQYGSATNPGGAILIGDPALVNGGASLNISNCSILNNHAGPRGGGLFNAHPSSTLVITHCTLAGNTSSYGGAIDNNGSLTVVDSQVYSNSVDTEGGGIFNQVGTALISTSVFSANFSFNGGAIANGGGAMTLMRDTLSANYGGQGAGIMNDASLLVQDSTIAGNVSSDSSGAGLLNRSTGTLILVSTVVTSNWAKIFGGGIYNSGMLTATGGMLSLNTASLDGGGGLVQDVGGTARLDQSAIVSNTASYGGGVLLFGGVVTLTNSTVSGNTTGDVGAGVYNHGANSTLSLANVTVAYNRTGYLKSGGGIDNDAGGTVNVKNSLIAWNSYQGISAPVFINDCNGPLSSGGYNLVRVDCGFSHQSGDQVGTFSSPLDPRIGPLLNNGGGTPTHALLAGSPAINSGNPSGCLTYSGTLLATDQRGATRPQGSACDIGAYEYGAAPLLNSLSPSSATTHSPALTLRLNGADFISGATALWNGSPLATTYISSTVLSADVPASVLSASGTFTVTVQNPGPGDGASGPLPFSVLNPLFLPLMVR